MKFLILSTLSLGLSALSALASDLPPGVVSARLLPGWVDQAGNRVSAIELQLEPGWKTYWRQPGDSGFPPSFDWQGSTNLESVTLHWPAPEAIWSGDELTLGYHDRLVLPFTASPQMAEAGSELQLAMDFGVCEKICVPAHVVLRADQPDVRPDPQILTALKRVPVPSDVVPSCHMTPIEDGLRLVVELPQSNVDVAAMEVIGQPDIWVSTPILHSGTQGTSATVELVPPSASPFDLDTEDLLITLIDDAGAIEMQGCSTAG
ncbi:protein-disulfide reductase DsbD domain-containing protein [Paracoccus seriniphilus]|uniref:protein-disulfide reductase DsbD domain-containing protein n=1 Tax=Paracoccus seriniphilus TaxID=184748 RepID=UPI0035670EBB